MKWRLAHPELPAEVAAGIELVLDDPRPGTIELVEAAAARAGIHLERSDQHELPSLYEVVRFAVAQGRLSANRGRHLLRAVRTRPDYDLRCQNCGAPHWFDCSIPSHVWNRIADPGAVLCLLCIDDLLAAAGIECDRAEFYFVGKALRSRLYEASTGDLETTLRELDWIIAFLSGLDLGSRIDIRRAALERAERLRANVAGLLEQ